MTWYGYLLAFAAGMIFANGVPHFVHGVSGAPFQSPFANPPGVGESSPLVNVWWGSANLGGAIVLLVELPPEGVLGWGVVAAGVVLAASGLAIYFGRLRNKRSA
jgi:hypothetical protein